MQPIKIVIVSHVMYPVLSPRSFRTTELAKQLVRMGHDVTLYTVWNEFDYSAYEKETGIKLKNLGKANLFIGNNILKKILNRLMAYPIIKLLPIVKRAIENENEFDFLITIAAPHSVHWGASFVKQKKFKCWVADCGDPYMKNPFAFHPFYFKWLEKRWCKKVDYITVPIEEAKNGYYEQFRDKIRVVPQGFDFTEVQLAKYEKNKIPTFVYAGNCYKPHRDITSFLEYLVSLSIDFKFIVYTKSFSFFTRFEEILKTKMELREYIPRQSLLYEMSKADFLINIRNNFAVQSPSKLIDYSLAKRPILDISSNFNEHTVFNQFIQGDYTNQLACPDVSEFDIKNVAKSFIELYRKTNNNISY